MDPALEDGGASARLRDVLTGVEDDLQHLRALRAEGATGDRAERALRERGEHAVRSARDPLEGAERSAS